MDNDAVALIAPLTVIAVGLDWCGGWVVYSTYIVPFLHQIGF